MKSLFHFAFHVRDLDVARRFYSSVLVCIEGRSSPTWVDFDFFNHQISLHLGEPFVTTLTGQVGDQRVPMPHFGLVLALPDWQAMAQRLNAAEIAFVLPPQVRFEGQPGEQWTMFFATCSAIRWRSRDFAICRRFTAPDGQRRNGKQRRMVVENYASCHGCTLSADDSYNMRCTTLHKLPSHTQ